MDLNFKSMRKIMIIIFLTICLFWGLQHINNIFNLFGKIIDIISPVLLGIVFAFIVNVLLKNIELRWSEVFKSKNKGKLKKFQRPICLLISFAAIIGIILILFLLIIPQIWKSLSAIGNMLPSYLERLETWWQNVVIPLGEKFYIPNLNLNWDKIITTATEFISKKSVTFFSSTLDATSSFFSGFYDVILGIIFCVYLLLQKETLLAQLRKVLFAYFPKEKIERLLHILQISNYTFSKFVTGQVTEAIILGMLCFVGMNILLIPYSTMISFLIGFTALIPIFGAFIGTAIGAFFLLIVSPFKAFLFVVFIIVLQQIDGAFIYPRVVGKSIGLPGIWVLFAVTIGGNAMGILGMLLSVPVCSVLYTLLQESLNSKKIKNN